jgi:coenzyme F420-reducing hydrogenase gamma subunit
MMKKLKVAILKLASCSGCQLTILNAEEELIPMLELIEFSYFMEASSKFSRGPYDVVLVEGSISTMEDMEKVMAFRAKSKLLVAIGSCATAGGLQALRNYSKLDEFKRAVYPNPEYLEGLKKSLPISEVTNVDLELRGCPINVEQVVQLLAGLVYGRIPRIPNHSVCIECKREGIACIMVCKGIPCLGPVTSAGCGAICPSMGRGCYGCFGPSQDFNMESLAKRLQEIGMKDVDVVLKSYNSYSEPIRRWLFKK